MKILLTLAFVSLTIIANGQIRYEKGYYIDNNNLKTECLIRNVDWAYNPEYIDVKENKSAVKERKDISQIKEFGIGKLHKYIRNTIAIDMSSDELDDNEISNNPEPEWEKRTVFLKVIVEGNACLYIYETEKMIRFFYSVLNGEIEQLVHKRYKRKMNVSEYDPQKEISYFWNSSFQTMLYSAVNCMQEPRSTFENMSYTVMSLKKVFLQHNACISSNGNTYVIPKDKKSFLPKIFAGVSLSSYKLGTTSFYPEVGGVAFGTRASFIVGTELEVVLPFNNNKFSIIAQGSTLTYKANGTNSYDKAYSIDYNTINLLGAIRYSSFLKNRVKLFVDGGFNKDIKVALLRPVVAAGVSFGKMSGEFRVFFPRNIAYEYGLLPGSKFSTKFLALKFSFL